VVDLKLPFIDHARVKQGLLLLISLRNSTIALFPETNVRRK